MTAITRVKTKTVEGPDAAGIGDQKRAPVTRWTDEPVDLVAIYDKHQQVCCLHRPPAPAIHAYCGLLKPSQLLGYHCVLEPGRRPPPMVLPAGDGRGALLDDIAFAAELFADLVGCPAIGLRLSRLDRAMCPRFHVDHVAIRMTCTYTGPGTEWIDRDIRHNGGPLDIDPSQEPVRCAEPGALLFLKGEQWTGNSGRGAIHRSPDVPAHGGHRVLLTVDAIWQS